MEASVHWLAARNLDFLLSLLIGVCSTLVLAAAAFVCACGILYKGQPAPGPIALPIIGHLHLIGRSLPHRALAHLSKTYGPLMSLRLGSQPLLIASSPDMAKLILHTHDKVFSGRPQNLSVLKNAFNYLDIVFSQPGPYWKLMRQLCFTEFFSAKRLDHFRSMREEEVHDFMLSILAAQGTPILIREKLQTTNSNLLSRMMLGSTTHLQELEASSKGVPALMELLEIMGTINVGDFIPWLAWMDLQGLGRRSKKAAHAVSSMFQEVIDRRRANRSPNDPPHDFLDVLLMASLDPKHTQLGIGDEHIKAVMMMDMFGGGTNPFAVTIEWALAELLANPEKMMIAKKEIEHIVGCSRLVQESDLLNLPYLRAVVNETLRLHPIAPLLAPRMSMEPCQISSYYIPKNTMVNVNIWAIHRDPKIWSYPLEFSPERFLNSNIDVLTQQCKFLPFGAGRRICPGSSLAILNVQSVLGSLIHAFDWKTTTKPYMIEKFGQVTALEDPLMIVPMPRFPSSVFKTILL